MTGIGVVWLPVSAQGRCPGTCLTGRLLDALWVDRRAVMQHDLAVAIEDTEVHRPGVHGDAPGMLVRCRIGLRRGLLAVRANVPEMPRRASNTL